MKSSVKFICALTIFAFYLSACTFGDKGREGTMDSTTVDTSQKANTSGGAAGAGASPAPAANTGKDTTAKDAAKTDSTSKSRQP